MEKDALLSEMPHVFPVAEFEGVVAPHDCEECNSISATLRGTTWREVTSEFLVDNSGIQSLLSPDAYVAFLPAWLRYAVEDPDSLIAGDLMAHLTYDPEVERFSPRQRNFIVRAAEYILAKNCYGEDDPVNQRQLLDVHDKWQSSAAQQGGRHGR